MMERHLNDEEMLAALAGDAGEHACGCAVCASELARLRRGIAAFRAQAHASADAGDAVWAARRSALLARSASSRRPVPRLAWASALLVLLVSGGAWLGSHARTEPPLTVTPAAAQQHPDDTLLRDVQRALRREVPSALEPAALIADGLTQAAAAADRQTP